MNDLQPANKMLQEIEREPELEILLQSMSSEKNARKSITPLI